MAFLAWSSSSSSSSEEDEEADDERPEEGDEEVGLSLAEGAVSWQHNRLDVHSRYS